MRLFPDIECMLSSIVIHMNAAIAHVYSKDVASGIFLPLSLECGVAELHWQS